MLFKSDNSLTLEAENGKIEKASVGGDKTRLLAMLFLTFTYFLVEIVVGYKTDSMALVADSFHMLSDVIALIIAYVSIKMSPKSWSKNTFGWARAEVLGALVNAVFLVALCFSILIESIQRFIEGVDIKEPKLILIVGTVGLVVNLLGLGLFHNHGHSHGGGHGHGHSHSQPTNPNPHPHQHATLPEDQQKGISTNTHHQIRLVGWALHGEVSNGLNTSGEQQKQSNASTTNDATNSDGKESSAKKQSGTDAAQMNMHGVFLHVLADALGSVIVIVSALIIWLTNWKYKNYVDPALSVVMVILILCSVWPLLIQSAMVLLQTVPTHIQIEDLKKRLLAKVPGAMEVHEFHVWQLAGNRIIASAHILCSDRTDYMRIGEQIKEFFHNEGIHSTTIQLEFDQPTVETCNEDEDIINKTSDCFLTCPSDTDADCISNSCCGIQKRKTASRMTNLAYITENSPPAYSSISRNAT